MITKQTFNSISKKKIIFCLIFIISVFWVTTCTGYREIERKDNLGRIKEITYYNGSTIDRVEEIQYYGNSHNPALILYKKGGRLDMLTYKSEKYFFKGNNLTKLVFYIHRDINGEKKELRTGMIKYFYDTYNNFKRIEYYSASKPGGEILIFGLDQYNNIQRKTVSRRIIEYTYNSKTKKAMQIGQYAISYNNGSITEMKSWIMDQKSKKIIKKEEKNPAKIKKIIKKIEQSFIKKSRGKEFIKQ